MRRPLRPVLIALVGCVPLLQGFAPIITTCNGVGSKTPDPEFTITSPADGTFTNDPTIVVEGTARRGGGLIADVTVNGVSVLPLEGDPQDGTWSTVVSLDPNAIFNEIYAEMTLSGGTVYRRRITVIAGDGLTTGFVPDGQKSLESIALRLNDTGLDEIEPTITNLVDIDPATLLPPGTQIIDEFCYADLFGLCIGSADAYIASNASPPSPSISSFSVNVDSQPNQVNGLVTLNDLYAKADVVDGDDGIGFSCQVTIQAATSTIDGDFALDPDAVDPSAIDVTQLGGVSVAFGNFSDSTSCNGLLGGVVEFFIDLFVGSFENEMRDALQGFLNQVDASGNTPLAAGIETALADVEIAGPIGDALHTTLDTDLFAVDEDADGITLGSDSAFTSLPVASGTCFDANGVELPGPVVCSTAAPCGETEMCLAGIGECVAPPDHPDFPASYEVAEPFPVLGATTPGALPYGLGLSIGTSAFNQLLKSELECGLLTTEVEELPGVGVLTGGLLSLLIPEIAMFPLSTHYKLELDPTVGAIITGQPGPDGELAELRIHGLQVVLRDVDEELPELIKVSIDARIGLDASFTDGALSFQLGSPDPMDDIDITFLVNRLGTDQGQLANIVSGLFATAAPGLADALGSFPLPDFLGLQLSEVEVGKAGQFLSLYLDLTPAP